MSNELTRLHESRNVYTPWKEWEPYLGERGGRCAKTAVRGKMFSRLFPVADRPAEMPTRRPDRAME
jgi:hypothetical protein